MLLHALGCLVMVSQVADTYTLRREACGKCHCFACAGLFACACVLVDVVFC